MSMGNELPCHCTKSTIDWGAMARDRKGRKLLKSALKSILWGWEDDKPEKEAECEKQAGEIVKKMKKR
uniref:Uncharacterized protein n=1 Tax=viral metagenome TaxID=1070528 RepID=A0A6M3L362_9ZZZZ